MRRAGLLLSVLAAALLAGAPHASALPASVGIAALNAQREANGIPGGIVEDPAWSRGCDHHITYLQANGGELTHNEISSRPGYTADGDSAGNSSVLSSGDSWATGNPWETAPIHLHQLLGPRLSITGVADRDGYVCMFTWPGYRRPAPADWITYTYPGPGTVGHRFEETAAESPFTPGEKVGIPKGTTTGPYLYVMFDGPFEHADATATSASLVGPDGPVDLAVVDNATHDVGGYLPTGMELIPRRPLDPRTTYTATVAATLHADTEFDAVDQPVQHTWSFTTAARPNAVSIGVQRDQQRASTVEVSVDSQAPRPTLTVTGPDGTELHPTLRRGAVRLRIPAAGRWRFCVVSGGDATEYDAAQRSVERSFDTPLDLALPRHIRHGRLRLSVPPEAVGRRAVVEIWVYGRTTSTSARRAVRLRRQTTIAVPSVPGAVRWWVNVKLRRFTHGGITYERVNLSRGYRHIR